MAATTVSENELWTPTRLVVVRFPSQRLQGPLSCDEYAPVKLSETNTENDDEYR